ncbi:type-1 restriction enzyme MjaXIP specificity protein [Gordonia terrae C-6]|uniref:Type-1 restriction enzyme MjaXIP specificity protein n=2 Tax=Gordoniaceae TaxID=85026 RepID=R7Y8F2_9ACTN|nr:type-1 restriction enzyme MjaXIP specificity protein [Gordonia terrae C-6]
MPKDMARGRIDRSTIARIDQSTASRLKQHLLTANDVVLSRRGDVGRTAWVFADDLPALCGTGSMRVHPGRSSFVRPAYLRFFFHTRLAADYLEGHAVGATMPNLNAGIVERMPVPIPPLLIQDSLIALLEALDELIESNRRRVDVLAEMARRIYREWFVKFRYPGHQDLPFIDSDLGPLPEGWRASTCGVELNFIGGGTPSKKEPAYWDGGTVPWYTPTDLTRTGWRYAAPPTLRITEQGVAKSSARVFPAGSVLMTSRATLGVLAVAATHAATNQGFIVILPDDRWDAGFIYEWLDSKATELAALGTGATFKEITKGAFKRFPFVVPAQQVLDAYRATTAPIEQQVRVLEEQIRKLSELRDLLLPKLVTGQIDVSSLDLGALVGDRVA